MKKILILYNNWDGKCITGGHFYEENMYQCMLENPQIEVDRTCFNRKRTFFNKLFLPIINLKYLKKCLNYNLIIFNSVEGWYFIPLLIFIRIFSNSKVAIVHHHFMYMGFSGIKRWFYHNLESSFLKLSNYIVTVSPYIKDLCNTIFPKKNIRIWPIPFSNKIIDCHCERKKGQLVYMGTINSRKGLIYLINALVILKQQNIAANLKIIGKIKDELYYEQLVTIINKNNLDVTFLGFIDDDTKNKILKESDIFVFPSLLEGYGMVLREVMSYGLPIVCFDNSAMPYLVENGINGILVENKNYEKMAQAISNIITHSSLRNKLSKGAYEATTKTITPEKYKLYLNSEISSIL